MASLEESIHGLRQALDAPLRQTTWRWLVRHRMSAVTQALREERSRAADGWLAARASTLVRERKQLLDRLSALGPLVLDGPDPAGIRSEVLRFLGDLEHHRQRVVDLVYDSVSLELGGSE